MESKLRYPVQMSGAEPVTFRISYARHGELRDDVAQQMARGGLLIRAGTDDGLALDAAVRLELVLPDGRVLAGDAKVLQVLAGFGVAVSVGAELIEAAHAAANKPDAAGAGPARHERVGAPPAAPAAKPEGPTRAEKIQQALRGSRDERNAILRDRDRSLYPFVLKNPQLNADDVLAIAKNAQMTPDLLKQIGERKDWFQRSAIALALARNPKTPPELAVRALEHVPQDALRQMAKGVGALPHVVQAARKKLLG
jgi:hypothetical protein